MACEPTTLRRGAFGARLGADTLVSQPPSPLLGTLVRLHLTAFRRAPHFGGRAVLAVFKAIGIAYAVLSAATLGFLLPDTLSVWAPGVSALDAVAQALLPALGALTLGRVLFQDVPTRGAEAFLLLPVPRQRIARAVMVRAALSPFNAAPLAFAVPFALRTVRTEAPGSAWAFVVGVAALVALSHLAVVLWKTRLGAEPGLTVAVVGAALGSAAGLDLATGGLFGPHADLYVALVGAVTVALGMFTFRGVEEALFLDRPSRAGARRTDGDAGFERPGVRAFLDLDARLVARARYPRGIVLNAVATSLAVAVYALGWGEGETAALALVFSAGAIAVSAGQFALPFASAHYDRLLTLPGATEAFVRAKLLGTAGSVAVLGMLQLAVALVLAPQAWPAVAAAVLFCAGVLAPVAVLGSTVAPKPLDVADRFMTSTRIQSLAPQLALAAAGSLAILLLVAFGPELGRAAMAATGALGTLALPLWARSIEARLRVRRHAVAARFRSDL